jgi:hypothetical protein
MSYIGNQAENKVSPAFMRENLSPDGSATYFDLIHDVPGYQAESLLVTINNVIQEPVSSYTIINDGNLRPRRLNFGVALATTDSLYVIHRGSGELYHTPPANSVGTTALESNLRSGNVDSFTATAGQTAFTLSEIPYNAASLDVYVNGIYQKPITNYTVTGSSTALTLSSGILVNDEVDVHHNTLRTTITHVADASVTSAKLDTNIAIGGTLAVTGTSTLTGNTTVGGNLTVTGNWTVDGTTTTLNTQTVEVEDNILQLNTTQASPDTATATTSGISVYRGNGVTQASLVFDDADDTWDLTNNLVVAGTTTITGTSTFTGDTTHNGDVVMATNKKIKAKGEAMTHSLHRSWVMGG